MSHTYTARISWSRDDAVFTDGRYSRAHAWDFDGGVTVPASSSPNNVRPPFSRSDAVDPEEALVAAASSCHMLSFLYLAARRGVRVDRYVDDAVGVMTPNERGKLWVSRITLRPAIDFGDTPPSAEVLAALHHEAHEECYIASSLKTEIVVEG